MVVAAQAFHWFDHRLALNRALSTSFIAALPAEERAEVADQLRAALDGVDLPVRFPYRGELQAWVKSP